MKCEHCGREMRASGIKASLRVKYCSAKCKQAAYRNKSTVTNPTVTPPKFVTPTDLNPLGLADSEMRHVARAPPGHTINTGKYKTADELGHNEYNRVPLPGDVDYEGVVKASSVGV